MLKIQSTAVKKQGYFVNIYSTTFKLNSCMY